MKNPSRDLSRVIHSAQPLVICSLRFDYVSYSSILSSCKCRILCSPPNEHHRLLRDNSPRTLSISSLLTPGLRFNAIWLSRWNRLCYLRSSIMFRSTQCHYIHHITINLRSWTRTITTRYVWRITSQTNDSDQSTITASCSYFTDGDRG